MNSRIKQLMKELEHAISDSLSRSAPVAEVIAKINDEGYNVFLILEATVGLNHQKENARVGRELVGTRTANSETRFNETKFNMNAHDVNFLKSLRISVDNTP